MVHSGAVLAANLSHLTGMRKHGGQVLVHRFRNDRDKRDLFLVAQQRVSQRLLEPQ